MIKIKHSGNFNHAESFLGRMKNESYLKNLDVYAQQGLQALIEGTPVDSGKTSTSWSYEIKKERGRYTINYFNSNIVDGVNIAIILQYGHGTATGGYVQGRDYINPSIQPVFDKIADVAWKEVTR